MGIIGDPLTRLLLRTRNWPREDVPLAYRGKSKLEVLFGTDVWNQTQGRAVLDFGCGWGAEAIEIAQHGAARVVGLDIRDDLLRAARESASRAGLNGRCEFTTSTQDKFDVVLSLDSMEHFSDPTGALALMANRLRPNGFVLMAFGPPWLHPLGHHLPLSPWAHLIFTESSLMRWRAQFKDDGAKRFCEFAGGLNKMTVAKFLRIVEASPLRFSELRLVPITKLKSLHNRLTREFTTAIVRCKLTLR